MYTRKLFAVFAALAAVSACKDAPSENAETVCPSYLRARIDRPTVTLRVADSARLQATALGCGGTVPLTTSWAWTSTASAVVRVDPASGWVYGVRAGVADVVATSAPPYGVAILSNITVVP